jgi:hypothetical protein
MLSPFSTSTIKSAHFAVLNAKGDPLGHGLLGTRQIPKKKKKYK